MRALHYIHASLLDFVENSRTGTTLFKIARFGLFAMIIFVGRRLERPTVLSI